MTTSAPLCYIRDMRLRRKPWYLRILTGDYWVALGNTVYYPRHIDNPHDYPAVLAHEREHLRQQADTPIIWWLAKYLLSRTFRYKCELSAHVSELRHSATVESITRRLLKYRTGQSRMQIMSDIRRLRRLRAQQSDPPGVWPTRERGSGGAGGPATMIGKSDEE